MSESGAADPAADRAFMDAALTLAQRGLGNVWPNPSVGCLIVAASGRVVGRGWTRPGGRPHAETEALRRAGAAAEGATVYVTLEPCNHHGKTPPCAAALAAAGVARVVVALRDPDPRTAGRGLETLRRAGIAVTEGVAADAAADLNAGFLLRIVERRPLVTLKMATSLDGRIATRGGDSRWITAEAARAWGHLLRARHDAILTGIGTVLADDPDLTCRLPGLDGTSPLRLVLDSRLRLPTDSRLVRTARRVPTWVLARDDAPADRRAALVGCGVEVIGLPADKTGRVDVEAAFRALADRGLTRILVEAGGALAATILGGGLADRLAWFRAPRLIGGDGTPAVAGLGVDKLAATPYFERSGLRGIGPDGMEDYRATR